MSVEKVTMALRTRLRTFFRANTTITSTLAAGTDPATVQVADASKFNTVHFMRSYPQALIFDQAAANTTPIAHVRIKSVDTTANTITFSDTVSVTIPAGALIKIAPNWTELQDVRLGDPTVLDSYPVICIEPKNKNVSWLTLMGTDETMNFDFFIHVLEDNSENAVITLARLTEDLEDMLMGDFHIKADMNKTGGYNRPYMSMVSNVTYAHSNKGAFLRTAVVSWTASMFWGRFIAEQNPELSPFD